MRNTHDIWVCEVCKFKWLAFTRIAPDRCPSAKCRSRKWNASGEDRTIEPEITNTAQLLSKLSDLTTNPQLRDAQIVPITSVSSLVAHSLEPEPVEVRELEVVLDEQ